MTTSYKEKQKLKSIYIPLCCQKKITVLQAAQVIGISPRSVSELKRKYKLRGDSAFTRLRTQKPYKFNARIEKRIIDIYFESWVGSPYTTFRRGLKDYYKINISYNSLRAILKKHNIKPYRDYKTKKEILHHSRKERPCTGELLQMDASKHDWFMNGTYSNLHGAIDDATHEVTGLYFCENECRLGYNEVLRQTFLNYGKPEAVYIDRHSSFVSTPKGKQITLEERLEYEKTTETHFVSLCKDLKIEIILALSAQGKGRIERLWQTLQGYLPFYFRYLNIKDNQSANEFLKGWLPKFNKEFKRLAESSESRWRNLYKKNQIDFLLAIKETKKTDKYGTFMFHQQWFEICSPRKCNIKFTLCLSEQFGIKALYEGKFYDVKLVEEMGTVLGKSMPQVEQDLIGRYLTNDIRENIS